ncbi:hypothetical protein CHLRE_12g501752v5 [Chlamydomonas reinhardtii]|uniref:Uncharacterized protein n=1 Tax=Chlamydomonas reinhardtii TaxID=3055 RepID=A0A2K3D372_CHLRE|nr:uncharacterized protein CHLRE_12g501752v5 [Chlamydomonas reinhardtii]PNW74980.1 hypothetical protein CHLRE_12g501752v5 [Chlamydomonas reinhardtii]
MNAERAAAAAESGPAAPAPSDTGARDQRGAAVTGASEFWWSAWLPSASVRGAQPPEHQPQQPASSSSAVGPVAQTTAAFAIAMHSEESRATLRHALRAFGLADAEVECFTDADIDFLLFHGFRNLETLGWARPRLLYEGGVRPVLVGYIRQAIERAAAAAESERAAAAAESGPAAPAPSDTGARDQRGAAVTGASEFWWSAWLPSASVRGAQPPEHQPQQPASSSSAVGPVAQTTAASHVSPAGHVPDVDCTNLSPQQQRLSATCRRRRAHLADPGQQ